jgi:hypothetical protein
MPVDNYDINCHIEMPANSFKVQPHDSLQTAQQEDRKQENDNFLVVDN